MNEYDERWRIFTIEASLEKLFLRTLACSQCLEGNFVIAHFISSRKDTTIKHMYLSFVVHLQEAAVTGTYWPVRRRCKVPPNGATWPHSPWTGMNEPAPRHTGHPKTVGGKSLWGKIPTSRGSKSRWTIVICWTDTIDANRKYSRFLSSVIHSFVIPGAFCSCFYARQTVVTNLIVDSWPEGVFKSLALFTVDSA